MFKNKTRVAGFVALFAVTGIVMLLISRAATLQSVSIEAESGLTINGAEKKDDPSASGGKLVKFASPVPPPATIKPQIRGAIDRDPYNYNKAVSLQNVDIPTTYQSIVNNFVLKIEWSRIQPNNSSEFNTTFIDDAIAEAKSRNMRIKLRVMSGIHAPDWVKNLEGGPFNVYDIDKVTLEEFSGTSPKYWTVSYKNAYSDLMGRLATKYDTELTMASVVNSMCTTIFAEPFIKNLPEGDNMNSFYNAGLTKTLDEQCQNNAIDIHNNKWVSTRTETAVNPLSYKGTNNAGETVEKFDVDFSIAWINRCRQVMGAKCVMGNNGFNRTSGADGSNYRRVIGAILCAGNPPPYFQTRQNTAIVASGNTLAGVLQYAIDVGAGMVEMPAQYKTTAITPAELAPLDSALESNTRLACPADRLLPNPT